MRFIVYVTRDELDGTQVRFRGEKSLSKFHILEANKLPSISEAIKYANILTDGIEIGGAESILAVHENLRSELEQDNFLPLYTNEMFERAFESVWEELSG
jgi:hypothetical protein